MVVVGADVHKRTHTFVAADEAGRQLETITVRADVDGHGGGFTTRLPAPGRPAPELVGQQVSAWEPLGTEGATGTHLHFEVHRGGGSREIVDGVRRNRCAMAGTVRPAWCIRGPTRPRPLCCARATMTDRVVHVTVDSSLLMR